LTTIIFFMLWALVVFVASWGGVLIKFSEGGGNVPAAGGDLMYVFGFLLLCGAAILGAIVLLIFWRSLRSSPGRVAWLFTTPLIGLGFIAMSEKSWVRPPPPPPEPQPWDLVSPAQMAPAEWSKLRLQPTIRDGKVVELRPAAKDALWSQQTLLPKLTDLEVLDYEGRWAYETSLREFLPHMKNLKRMRFPNSKIAVNVLESPFTYLAQLPGLEYLDLHGSTNIYEGNMRRLAKSESLVELDLSDTTPAFEPSPQSLGFPRLEILHLQGTPLDDKQLLQLAKLPSLRRINVSRTKVTSDGVAAFGRMRPDVEVETKTPD
jgi:hypothetical protein